MNSTARKIALVVALGTLMVMFDVTVTAIAIPTLTTTFGTTLSTVQWVTTGYTLALVAVMPTSAWLVSRFGDKRTYLTALALFVGGSVMAGLAWNIGSLVAFRALQGLGGGLLAPVGMTIVIRSAEVAHRGRAMAVLGLPLFIGPVLGPTLGGVIVDSVGWRVLFLINLPIGMIAIALAALLFPRSETGVRTGLDWRGLLTLPPGAVLVVAGLSRLGETGDVADPIGLVSTALGITLILRFALRAQRVSIPLLNTRLLRRRPMWSALATLAPFTAAYFGSMIALPIYVQQVRGDSATIAGMLTIAQALVSAVTLQIATRLVDRIDPRRIALVGISSALAGYVAVAACIATNAPYPLLATVSILIGIGAGATMMPLMTASTRNLPDTDVPSGSTLLNTNSQLFSAMGAAALATTLSITSPTSAPTGHWVALAYLVPISLVSIALVVAATALPRDIKNLSDRCDAHFPEKRCAAKHLHVVQVSRPAPRRYSPVTRSAYRSESYYRTSTARLRNAVRGGRLAE
ncbi:putative drug resistance transporter [Gordonia effusa NBRC 100432]|uniref:Putative drug resistance transporter n=1 Tax=Gordonia effusa NBRC 100432 TaxID=1077974 RepID=H0QWL7_9ACTN|nr:putative drug resistance transporter [Gordonia effusa NBRC 100432]